MQDIIILQKYDSQKIFNKLRSLKIKIIKINEPFLCNNL